MNCRPTKLSIKFECRIFQFLFHRSFSWLYSPTDQAIHQIGGQNCFHFLFHYSFSHSIHRPTKLSIKVEGTIFFIVHVYYSFGRLNSPTNQAIHQIEGDYFFHFLFHYSFGGLYSLTNQANFKLEGRIVFIFFFFTRSVTLFTDQLSYPSNWRAQFFFIVHVHYSFGRLDSPTDQTIHQTAVQIT